jgi:hypothetical protein
MISWVSQTACAIIEIPPRPLREGMSTYGIVVTRVQGLPLVVDFGMQAIAMVMYGELFFAFDTVPEIVLLSNTF